MGEISQGGIKSQQKSGWDGSGSGSGWPPDFLTNRDRDWDGFPDLSRPYLTGAEGASLIEISGKLLVKLGIYPIYLKLLPNFNPFPAIKSSNALNALKFISVN